MDAEEVRSSPERQFRRMKLLADRVLEQVDDRQFFHVIIKHVAGNLCRAGGTPIQWTGM